MKASLQQQPMYCSRDHNYTSRLQIHDQWHQTHHPFHITPWVNSWYRINLDTIFSCRISFNSYRIAYTSWIRDLLLLLLLVLTCQISVPTLTTRFYVIYYCGWWCRGSTHVQMWWQGQTALQDLVRIMACIRNENLHGWRVNKSSRCSHKEFLLTDHWITQPESREHNNVHITCCKT